MTDVPAALVTLRATHMALPVDAAFSLPVAALRERFGDALQAVLLYGSCRRQETPADGVIDLYAIVADYASAHAGYWARWANALLPPNVYYLESHGGPAPLRAKYAVLSRADFQRLNASAFHPYFWARFCQPVTLLYAANEHVTGEIARALACATVRFLRETAPLLDPVPVAAASVWTRGFRFTYGAELRPESGERADVLVGGEAEYFHAALAAALPAVPELARTGEGRYLPAVTPAQTAGSLRSWRVRRVLGALLSVLRLAKAAFTFSGGVDYAAWKVERHTGVHIAVTPRLRRFPLLFGWRVVWQLLRRGALK